LDPEAANGSRREADALDRRGLEEIVEISI
jgi:hypothetical protein